MWIVDVSHDGLKMAENKSETFKKNKNTAVLYIETLSQGTEQDFPP